MTDSSESMDFLDRNRNSWSSEEDGILNKLVKKYGTRRWQEISKAMVDMYELHGKSGKQCRERWVNHLDPKINKSRWSLAEEKIIFDAHKTVGNKWKQIAKLLDNRTDNSIKNHFYSILRKGLRRINKMLGDRKSTEKVKNIRTSVLSKLWKMENENSKNGSDEGKDLSEAKIYELLFEFSMMKSGNVSEKNLSNDIKDSFQELIGQLMSLSGEEKIKKEIGVQINKEKKIRKLSQQSQSSNQEESRFFEKNEAKDEVELEKDASEAIKSITTRGFMVNIVSPEKNSRSIAAEVDRMYSYSSLLNLDCEKSDMERSDGSVRDDQLKLTEKKESYLSTLKVQEEKCEEEFMMPTISINLDEQQSVNLSCSQRDQDSGMNFLPLNISPRYPNNLFDQLLTRTPRINSPSAFNFYNSSSTAYTFKGGLGKDSMCEGSGIAGDSEFKRIVETLRQDINVNQCSSSSSNSGRVNSSKSSFMMEAPPSFKYSGPSSGSLTPRSRSGVSE